MSIPVLSSGLEILCGDYTYGSMAMKIVSHQPDKLLSCMAPPESICEDWQRILMLLSGIWNWLSLPISAWYTVYAWETICILPDQDFTNKLNSIWGFALAP